MFSKALKALFALACAATLALLLTGHGEEATICGFALGYPLILLADLLLVVVDRASSALGSTHSAYADVPLVLLSVGVGWAQWLWLVPRLLSVWRGSGRVPSSATTVDAGGDFRSRLVDARAPRSAFRTHLALALLVLGVFAVAVSLQVWLWRGMRHVPVLWTLIGASGRFGSNLTTIVLLVPALAAAVVCGAILKSHFRTRGALVPKSVAAGLVAFTLSSHFVGFVLSLWLWEK